MSARHIIRLFAIFVPKIVRFGGSFL